MNRPSNSPRKRWFRGNERDSEQHSAGFTKIPNDILETLARTYLSPSENRAVTVILRMTFGWHKDADTIANRQFRNSTGIKDRANMYRPLHKLEARRIIVVSRDYAKAATYRINSNLEEWQLLSRKTTPPKKRSAKFPIVGKDNGSLSNETTRPESVQTTPPSSAETPSEEIRKERKQNKESALPRDSLDFSIRPGRDSDHEDRRRPLPNGKSLFELFTQEVAEKHQMTTNDGESKTAEDDGAGKATERTRPRLPGQHGARITDAADIATMGDVLRTFPFARVLAAEEATERD